MSDPELNFPDELEAVDYLMLRGEGDPRSRGSMLSVALLDRVPDFAQLRLVFERASREFVRLRQRVVVPTLPVTAPRWVVDPDFDLDYHLSRQSLAGPGTQRALLDFAGKLLAAPIDTSRPLWQVIVVEGLAIPGCKAALLLKMHHAVTDGVGGMQLFKSLYDFHRIAKPRPMPPAPVPEDLSAADLTRRGLSRNVANTLPGLGAGLGAGLGSILRRGRDIVQQPGKAIAGLREQVASAQRVLGPLPVAPSPLLKRRSLGRRLDAFDFPLEQIRRAAKAAGVSVNDAYIAAVCGGLRRYHDAMGVPIEALPLAMPVNLRKDDDPAAGNRIAGARLAVPIAEADPVSRMKQVRALVLTAVHEPAMNILGAIAPLLSQAPAPLLAGLTDSIASMDIQASNVPGYPEAPYIAGCKVVKLYPFGPLPGVALMIVMASQAGQCFVGTHSDTASFSDMDLFIACLQEGFAEVFDSAGSVPAARGKTRTRAKPKARAAPSPRQKTGARRRRQS